MNQTDFLKFLSSNNLNGAYHVGKQVLNNYSLPEAVSLFGQQEDGIYNAYDLLKFKPERVRINCGATGLVKTSINHKHCIFHLLVDQINLQLQVKNNY